jgi:hypothetical protein
MVWNMCGGLDWQALPIVLDMLDVPADRIEQVIIDCIAIRDFHSAQD